MRIVTTPALSAAGLVLLAHAATAQTVVQVPLNYNFNGIVHAGEEGDPDAAAGYRSISDRGLDFTAGVPSDALTGPYNLVSAAGALDIVHVGDRNAVDNGSRPFDATVDGDNIGIQPTWLVNTDQTGPQTTTLASPIALSGVSTATFLMQVSNGGGALDVVIGFQGGGSTTGTITAGDWFGGAYPGMAGEDNASPNNNLSIAEGVVDLSAFAGQSVSTITFQNQSNLTAGYAVLACNIETGANPTTITPLPLDYNFNGIVHAGEEGLPDELNGYRSISDRGLDFTAGLPSDSMTDPFTLVDQANTLDIVHLGDRNTVNNGGQAFDAAADGDAFGVQPTWLTNTDQTGPQTTIFGSPYPISSAATGTVLFQISNGGGSFDVTYGLQSGGSITGTIGGGDWFGGTFPGTGATDLANPDANLNLTVGSIDLAAAAGDAITSITFSNSSNLNAGVAILAANLETSGIGTNYCNANANSTGVPGVMGASGSTVVAQNDFTLEADDLPVGQFGIFVVSTAPGNVPVGSGVLCLSGAIGRFTQPSQIFQIDPSGHAELDIDLSMIPRPTGTSATQPGDTWYFQAWHRDSSGGMSTSNFTDGYQIDFQ